MAATQKRYLRHPRTTRERRYNQDKHDLLIRAKRRNKRLPNAYDDYFPCHQKGWKAKGRKNQYHECKAGYAKHFFEVDFWDIPSRHQMDLLVHQIKKSGCSYQWDRDNSKPFGTLGVHWFGPDFK